MEPTAVPEVLLPDDPEGDGLAVGLVGVVPGEQAGVTVRLAVEHALVEGTSEAHPHLHLVLVVTFVLKSEVDVDLLRALELREDEGIEDGEAGCTVPPGEGEDLVEEVERQMAPLPGRGSWQLAAFGL